MTENKKQQECRYCHSNPLTIMDAEDSDAEVLVSGNMLQVSVIDTSGAYINYCPMCGRKL